MDERIALCVGRAGCIAILAAAGCLPDYSGQAKGDSSASDGPEAGVGTPEGGPSDTTTDDPPASDGAPTDAPVTQDGPAPDGSPMDATAPGCGVDGGTAPSGSTRCAGLL